MQEGSARGTVGENYRDVDHYDNVFSVLVAVAQVELRLVLHYCVIPENTGRDSDFGICDLEVLVY